MESSARIVTLTTDFGLQDYFVGAVKGVLLSLNPALKIVDISHLIAPHDVRSGAFTLGQAYTCFPSGTIHVAVVDPGVGTARKGLVVWAGGHLFVAPDNGLLSYVLATERAARIFEITSDHYFRKPVSSTFHGRDVFAPVAAWLSRDIAVEQFGPQLTNPVRFPIPSVKRVRENLLQAEVQAVDRFGNLITSLRLGDLPVYEAPGGRGCKILAAQREITAFRRTFAEGSAGEVFVVPGSTGFLEIVMRDGSAASLLNLAVGAAIGVVLT